METKSIVEEAPVSSKEALFQVTPFSRVFATALFIILPFIGAWIGYIYGNNNQEQRVTVDTKLNTPNQIIDPELNTEAKITPETSKINWVNAIASAEGKEITIQYPTEIPVDVTALEENKPFALGIDPGFPNYTLPLTSNKEILVAELTTDLKYLFYLKKDAGSGVVTLYKGTVSSKIIEKITDYSLSVIKEILDDQFSSLMPLVTVDDFILYNTQLNATSNNITGNIATIENSTPLYVAPCAFDRYGNVSFSPDKLHIVWNCSEDGIYISDWKNTQKVLEFSNRMNPVAVSFMNNQRIRFVNATEGNNILRAPYHSVKIDGTDLRLEEGDVYLGY